MVALSAFLGAAFAALMTVATGGSLFTQSARSYLILGILTGLLISSATLTLENALVRFAPRPLWFDFFVMPAIQTGFIVGIYDSLFILILGMDNFLQGSYTGLTLIISFAITALVNLITNLNRLLGANVFRGLFLGTYRKPVNESRFVMFLDIAGSTTIAEKLGDLKFHAFLNDFFCDIAVPIVNCHGEIYKYVGDEVIITWKKEGGCQRSAALTVFFEVESAIESRREHYQCKYGEMPEFRAGLHFGRLVAGEMGLNKQEIAFSGDVMNTTARIQAECRTVGERFLVSDDALTALAPTGAAFTGREVISMGSATLRGKTREIAISAVR